LLAEWTGDAIFAYEAYLARPDLPAASASLSQVLLRSNHVETALPHLRTTLKYNPFHRIAARSLYVALGEVGDREGQTRCAAERDLIAKVVPQLAPREAWFGKAAVEPIDERGALQSVPATPRVQPRVSLTMIVRNEEKNLPGCLQCVHDLFDDIVVVDTGSQDRTKEEAAKYGARVFDFPWIDHFAAARNEALRHANGEWVMWLDADDRLDEDNRSRVRQLFASLGNENDAYATKVRSAMDEQRSTFRILDQVRLFRRHPQIFWKYRVHEQILWSVRQLQGGVRWSDVTIDHIGYQDGSLRKSKLQRNIRLLQLEAKDNPEDAFVLFNLGWTTLDLERPTEALPLLQRSLLRSAPDSSILRKIYSLLIRTHRQLRQPAQALSACAEGRTRFPDDPELMFEEAILKNEARDQAGAADALLRLLQVKPGRFFASVDPALRGYKTRHMLADLYREMGRLKDAEHHWRLAVEENPAFAPSWLGLGNLYCKSERWEDLDKALAHLEKHHPTSIEASMLRARRHMARREFSDARSLLDDLIRRWPNALGPRILQSHALLQQGQDMVAAEQALRDVLALDPNQTEARRNLEILQERTRR
jgi:glycosyltransferase involved in cell wall biosynthesis